MVDYGLLIGLISIAIAIFFGLRGFRTEISGTLKSIKENTKHLEKIRDVVVKLDERTERMERILELLPLRGTRELVLSNLGKTKITAEPGREETTYFIEFEKPIVRPRFIKKKSLETGLAEEEKRLFGKEVFIHALGPNKMVIHIPSTDPATCSNYISRLLKWLNTEYWEALKELEKYEEISIE
ncbi:MAG: hypothetical protein ACXQTI_08685 [Candidatus Nezhaarchaeales archaeon]